MADQMNTQAIAQAVRIVQKVVLAFTEENVRKILRDRLEEEAVEGSSLSDHTLEDLAAMGHPYRRRFPKDTGPHEDHFIHRQTEGGVGFVDSFVSEVRRKGSDAVEFKLRNTAPHWQYLKHGTDKMRARPLHEWLARVAVEEVFPEFARAQRRSFGALRNHFRSGRL